MFIARLFFLTSCMLLATLTHADTVVTTTTTPAVTTAPAVTTVTPTPTGTVTTAPAVTTVTPTSTGTVTTTAPVTTTTPVTTVTPTTTGTATITTTPVVTVDRPVIVTSVPAPKEAIETPSGYSHCFTVKAGWYQDTWVAEHQVCEYANSPSGIAWVEGYWACNRYDATEGKCTNWDWKTAHWETKRLIVY